MKRIVSWILCSILLLAVFSVVMLGCDWVGCPGGAYKSSSDACFDYCTSHPGCKGSNYNNLTGYCTCTDN